MGKINSLCLFFVDPFSERDKNYDDGDISLSI